MAEGRRHSIRWLAWTLGVPASSLRRLASEAERHYRPFQIVRGGKRRQIDNPSPELKDVQRRIRACLLSPVELPRFVHGCVKGRSPLTNASPHQRRPSLAQVDIKNFYPSVSNVRVYAIWKRLGYGPSLAKLLTRLTTVDFHLPQGAPTSDALANLAMTPADAKIERVADELDLRLTRYVDDITLSGEPTAQALSAVIKVLRDEGFSIRHRKTRRVGSQVAHRVTGYSVNNPRGPSVGRKERDRVRAAVHQLICARRREEDTTDAERSVRGRISHLNRTNPGTSDKFIGQLRRAGILGEQRPTRRVQLEPTPRTNPQQSNWQGGTLPRVDRPTP